MNSRTQKYFIPGKFGSKPKQKFHHLLLIVHTNFKKSLNGKNENIHFIQ